ncbi:MAG: YlbF family regulator [Candidatus Saccharibacteria bacterium]|nr:YlbF family regulator [Candidatus Saccharibacteria bacterium]
MEKNNSTQKVLFVSRDDAVSVKVAQAIFNTLVQKYALEWTADAAVLNLESVDQNHPISEPLQAKGYKTEGIHTRTLNPSDSERYRIVITLGQTSTPSTYVDADIEVWDRPNKSSGSNVDAEEIVRQIEAKVVKLVNKLHEYMDPRLASQLQGFVSTVFDYVPEVVEFKKAKDDLHAHPESLALWQKKQEIQETMKTLQDSGLPVDDQQQQLLSETMAKMRDDANIMRYLRAETFVKRATGYIGYILEQKIGVDFAPRKEC